MVKKSFIGYFSSISIMVIILDQLLKYLVINFNPKLGGEILAIHLVKNTGAGFGLLQNQSFWLGLVSLLVALVIVFSYRNLPKDRVGQTLFALFLGGVLGNMIDRMFRNYVVDFIDFSFWPAFNLADAVITVSIIGIIAYYWKHKDFK